VSARGGKVLAGDDVTERGVDALFQKRSAPCRARRYRVVGVVVELASVQKGDEHLLGVG
jgi:hypothetical protein